MDLGDFWQRNKAFSFVSKQERWQCILLHDESTHISDHNWAADPKLNIETTVKYHTQLVSKNVKSSLYIDTWMVLKQYNIHTTSLVWAWCILPLKFKWRWLASYLHGMCEYVWSNQFLLLFGLTSEKLMVAWMEQVRSRWLVHLGTWKSWKLGKYRFSASRQPWMQRHQSLWQFDHVHLSPLIQLLCNLIWYSPNYSPTRPAGMTTCTIALANIRH